MTSLAALWFEFDMMLRRTSSNSSESLPFWSQHPTSPHPSLPSFQLSFDRRSILHTCERSFDIHPCEPFESSSQPLRASRCCQKAPSNLSHDAPPNLESFCQRVGSPAVPLSFHLRSTRMLFWEQLARRRTTRCSVWTSNHVQWSRGCSHRVKAALMPSSICWAPPSRRWACHPYTLCLSIPSTSLCPSQRTPAPSWDLLLHPLTPFGCLLPPPPTLWWACWIGLHRRCCSLQARTCLPLPVSRIWSEQIESSWAESL